MYQFIFHNQLSILSESNVNVTSQLPAGWIDLLVELNISSAKDRRNILDPTNLKLLLRPEESGRKAHF